MTKDIIPTNKGQVSLIQEDLNKKFENETGELKGLTKLILALLPEYFNDVKGVRLKIFFSKKPLNSHDGQCKKLEDSVRFKLGVDYFIMFHKQSFDKLNRIEKAKLIIHELHHITRQGNELKIRKHNEIESFCELPSHDLFSDKLVMKIKEKLEEPQLEATLTT